MSIYYRKLQFMKLKIDINLNNADDHNHATVLQYFIKFSFVYKRLESLSCCCLL